MPYYSRNLGEALSAISMSPTPSNDDEFWRLSVLRQDLVNTAMENIEDAEEKDWNLPLKVRFIGEEGVDAGGLSREFFSLFFRETPMLENNTFSVKPEFLNCRKYYILGRLVAKALIFGHPGPRCLSYPIAKYITTGQEPGVQDIGDDDLPGEVAVAVKQVKFSNQITFPRFMETIYFR